MDARPAGRLRNLVTGFGLFTPAAGGWTTPRALAVVGAFAVVLFFANLGSARTITAHEAHIIQCAREMDAAGNWLVPRIAGETWLEKPPMPQWAASVGGAVRGRIDALAARFPAALCGLAGVLIFTALVSRLRGPTTAVLSGLVLASSYYTVIYSRLAESDIYLWVIVLAALALFARDHVASEPQPGWRSWSALGFFACLGLSQLTKGPLFGAAVILAPCAAWVALHRGRGWKWFVCPLGWLCTAAGLWWFVAVLFVHSEALDLWLYHTVGRMNADTAFNPQPVWHYFTTLPIQLLPWTFFVLPALPASFRRARRGPGSADRLLWVWFGAMFVMLSVASGKHHHYLIHALPPFAVWTAEALPWWRTRIARLWGSVWYRRVSTGLAAAVIVAVALTNETWAFGHRGPVPAWEVFLAGAIAITGGVLIGRACARGNGVRAAALLFGLVGAGFVYFNAVWLDRTDGYRAEYELFRRLDASLPPGEPVVIFGTEPTRVLLELTRPTVVVEKSPDELRAACAARPGCCVVTSAASDELVRATLRAERVDQVPRPRWKGDPRTHIVVYHTAP